MKRHQKVNGSIIVGLTERVQIKSANGKRKTITAKVDTGATRSSIDVSLASDLRLGPVIKKKMVKSAHGNRVRPVIEADVQLADKRMKSEFTIADRSHMKYKVLIGVNLLKEGFLVDPSLEK